MDNCYVKLKDFDRRICDVEKKATNTETYREFLINTYKYFYGDDCFLPNFDKMTEREINELLDEADMLWEK